MSFDVDDLLDKIDQWKFKLHDRLKRMTAEEQTEYWAKLHRRGLTTQPRRPKKAAGKAKRKRAASTR